MQRSYLTAAAAVFCGLGSVAAKRLFKIAITAEKEKSTPTP